MGLGVGEVEGRIEAVVENGVTTAVVESAMKEVEAMTEVLGAISEEVDAKTEVLCAMAGVLCRVRVRVRVRVRCDD